MLSRVPTRDMGIEANLEVLQIIPRVQTLGDNDLDETKGEAVAREVNLPFDHLPLTKIGKGM
jgi:hypothetical protein